MAQEILISYRRSDSKAITDRIRDRLEQYYGADSVFMDLYDIPAGPDYRGLLQRALAPDIIVVVVIGKDWIGARPNGPARIDDADDPVRKEIERALAQHNDIVPVLVDGADMPDAAKLPASLQDFSYHNAASIETGPDFHAQVDRLIDSLDRLVMARSSMWQRWLYRSNRAARRPAVWLTAGAAGAVTLAAILVLSWGYRPPPSPTACMYRTPGALNPPRQPVLAAQDIRERPRVVAWRGNNEDGSAEGELILQPDGRWRATGSTKEQVEFFQTRLDTEWELIVLEEIRQIRLRFDFRTANVSFSRSPEGSDWMGLFQIVPPRPLFIWRFDGPSGSGQAALVRQPDGRWRKSQSTDQNVMCFTVKSETQQALVVESVAHGVSLQFDLPSMAVEERSGSWFSGTRRTYTLDKVVQ